MTEESWPATDDEQAAIDAFCRFIRSMADLLHHLDDVRFMDPGGGHVID